MLLSEGAGLGSCGWQQVSWSLDSRAGSLRMP